MEISQDKLQQILSNNPYIHQWRDALNKILPEYDITTLNRISAFIGETYVESTAYTALHENLNYRAESLMRSWPSRFPTIEIANQYAHNPEMIANRAYSDRMGNGNEASGDGWKYCGRGLIQLTGHDNYQQFADSIEMDINEVPAYLQTFEGAIQSACWFFEDKNLNQFSDIWDINTLSIRINGGTNALEERITRCNIVKQILGS
jgi:putative chitinase